MKETIAEMQKTQDMLTLSLVSLTHGCDWVNAGGRWEVTPRFGIDLATELARAKALVERVLGQYANARPLLLLGFLTTLGRTPGCG